ncbi:trehalose operon repressor TreR [Aliivibrio fischeri]|uniref:trehalose operon repressor TreR n=1 Tax=Aliivibrio fischeri TaxID=668 RepID=UPI000908276C|nr:trehalose operon repressor TreR [Aliivibrio fischeri]
MTKKLTILDIAKMAGVGKSTVSRVLTNDPKVKQETRLKVEQIIKESGFVPSKSAQGMRGGSQKVIGIIISRLDSVSENKAVSGILETLYQSGYDAVIMESQFDRQKTNEHLSVLQKRNVDGVIVFGYTDCDVQSIEEWKEKAVVIAIDTDKISSVNYDNKGVIKQALEHLTSMSFKNIAYVGVNPSDKTTGKLRLESYLEWCKEHQCVANYATGQLDHNSAYALVDSIINDELEAVVCASDTLALGVAKRLQELQRNDIQVTGVGGTELLSFIFPNVISINLAYEAAGKTAATVLMSQLNGKTAITHITHPLNPV